jgi:hypothetical protein
MCPYWDFDDSEVDHGCRIQMELDALELLKEQETELCDRCGRVRLKSKRDRR